MTTRQKRAAAERAKNHPEAEGEDPKGTHATKASFRRFARAGGKTHGGAGRQGKKATKDPKPNADEEDALDRRCAAGGPWPNGGTAKRRPAAREEPL